LDRAKAEHYAVTHHATLEELFVFRAWGWNEPGLTGQAR